MATSLREALGYSSELAEVFRHLPGKHDQKTHGRKGAASIASRDDMVAWGEERGIKVSFGQNADLITDDGMVEVAQAIEDMQDRFPVLEGEWGDHPNGWYKSQRRGLTELEMGGVTVPGAVAQVEASGGRRITSQSVMRVQSTTGREADVSAILSQSSYDTTVHEMGHVMHRTMGMFGTRDPGSFDKIIMTAKDQTWGRWNLSAIQDDLSEYVGKDNSEFFAEAFLARNSPSVRRTLSDGARQRLDQFADRVNAAAREMYGIDGDTI